MHLLRTVFYAGGLLLLAACGGPESDFEGEWISTKSTFGGFIELEIDFEEEGDNTIMVVETTQGTTTITERLPVLVQENKLFSTLVSDMEVASIDDGMLNFMFNQFERP